MKSRRVLSLLLVGIMLLCSSCSNNVVFANKKFKEKTSRLMDSYIDGYEEGYSDVPIYPFVEYTSDTFHNSYKAIYSYGFINENGVIVCDPVYDWYFDFGDWYMVAFGQNKQCRSFFVISKDDQRVTKYGEDNLCLWGEIYNYIYLIDYSTHSAVVLDLNGDLVAESHFEDGSKYDSASYWYYGKYFINESNHDVYDFTTGNSYYIDGDDYRPGFGDTLYFVKDGSWHFFSPDTGILFPDNYYEACRAIPNGDGYYLMKKTQGGFDIRNNSNELMYSIDHDYCEAYKGFFVAYDDSEPQKLYTYSLSGELIASKTFDVDIRDSLDRSFDIGANYVNFYSYNREWISIKCSDTDKYKHVVYDKNLNVIFNAEAKYYIVKDRVNGDLYAVTPDEIENLNTGKIREFSEEFNGAEVLSISDGKIFVRSNHKLHDDYYYLTDMRGNVYFAYKPVDD